MPGAETFLKHDMKQNFSENMITLKVLILLRGFEEKVKTNKRVKNHLHAPAITASCDWLKKCLQCFDAVGWAAGRASGL